MSDVIIRVKRITKENRCDQKVMTVIKFGFPGKAEVEWKTGIVGHNITKYLENTSKQRKSKLPQ